MYLLVFLLRDFDGARLRSRILSGDQAFSWSRIELTPTVAGLVRGSLSCGGANG